ncbi:MAG: flagellar export chaperone FlgN [Phycisphaerales bacterium]|nr:flagellar export chaperone FlgN [Phycisphaerales bacterium]
MAVFRQVVTLLDEHRRLYVQLDGLARRQSEHIEADDTDGLLAVLAERQSVIDLLDHAQRKLEPARRDWERVSHEVSPDEREHIRLVLAEVTALAAQVAARDEDDRRRLESRRDEIADEMVSLTRSRKAFAAYGAPGTSGAPGAGPQARFQDREG